jgi:transcriptional regulator with XRE-family HTH domain
MSYRGIEMPLFVLTPSLCRAARGLVGWQQLDLSEKSGVSKSMIGAFEAKGGQATMSPVHSDAIIAAFEAAGLRFIAEDGAGAGVRFAEPSITGTTRKISFFAD